jgi:hypothetical protein
MCRYFILNDKVPYYIFEKVAWSMFLDKILNYDKACSFHRWFPSSNYTFINNGYRINLYIMMNMFLFQLHTE